MIRKSLLLSIYLLLLTTICPAQNIGNKNGTLHILGIARADSGLSIPVVNPTQRYKNKFKDTVAMLYRDSTTGSLMWLKDGVPTPIGAVDSATNIVANVVQTSQTGSITLFDYTDLNSFGTYQVYTLEGFLIVNAVTASSVTLNVSYSDIASNSISESFVGWQTSAIVKSLSALGTLTCLSFSVNVVGSSHIIVSTTVTGSSINYHVGSILKYEGRL